MGKTYKAVETTKPGTLRLVEKPSIGEGRRSVSTHDVRRRAVPHGSNDGQKKFTDLLQSGVDKPTCEGDQDESVSGNLR